jgi:hypothetical protein
MRKGLLFGLYFMSYRPSISILKNKPEYRAPIHVFHHLVRVTFRFHIKHKQVNANTLTFSVAETHVRNMS